MPASRAALVTAASTPLALPVMIEAPFGRDFTYSVTRLGAAKCLLPTIAIRIGTRSARGRYAFADVVDVLLEHLAELLGLAVIVVWIGPAVPRVQDLARHTGDAVGDVQAEDRVNVRVHAAQLAFDDRRDDRARVLDRHTLTHAKRPADPTRVQHPHVGMVLLHSLDEHVRVALWRENEER